MKTYLILLTAMWVATCADRALGQGNLVVNGTFDTDALGWSFMNGNSYFDIKGGNPPGSVVLDEFTPSGSDPTISQTVGSLSTAETYVVTGEYRRFTDRGTGLPTELSFGVAIDGIFLFESADPQDLDWHTFSFLYTANAPSALLSLSAQRNGTGVAYSIDNIVIQVPEPSSLGLLGLGAAAYSILARRRRSSWTLVSPR
jgi:hypothetical protein